MHLTPVPFSVGAQFAKAEEREGELYLTLIASDTGPDRTKGADREGLWVAERVNPAFLEKMRKQAWNGELVLNSVHSDALGFGVSVGHDDAIAEAKKKETGYDTFAPVFRLDRDDPRAVRLWKEVDEALKGGKPCRKGASIGGFTVKAQKTYDPKLNGVVKELVDGYLHEVTTTFPNAAANPRTGFAAAIAKTIDWDSPEVPILDENGEEMSEAAMVAKGLAGKEVSENSVKTAEAAGGVSTLAERDLTKKGERKMEEPRLRKIEISFGDETVLAHVAEEDKEKFVALMEKLQSGATGEPEATPRERERELSRALPSAELLESLTRRRSTTLDTIADINELSKEQKDGVVAQVIEGLVADAAEFLRARHESALETLDDVWFDVLPQEVYEMAKAALDDLLKAGHECEFGEDGKCAICGAERTEKGHAEGSDALPPEVHAKTVVGADAGTVEQDNSAGGGGNQSTSKCFFCGADVARDAEKCEKCGFEKSQEDEVLGLIARMSEGIPEDQLEAALAD
jgi:hypothetical protein